MPLETATYINDFVVTNPAASDGMNNADDHMRMIKAVLKNTFPGVSGAITASYGGFLARADGAVGTPAYTFASEPTLGFYRKAAGQVAFTGGLLLGSTPIGAVIDFAGATAPAGFLPCDGQAVSKTTYPELFAAIGYTWGGSGDSFNVPNLANRFRRHRADASLAGPVGTLQGAQVESHTHAVSGTTGSQNADHFHTFSGTTGGMNANNPHTHTSNANITAYAGVTGGGSFGVPGTGAATINSTNIDHGHSFSGSTSGISQSHQHAFSVTSGAYGSTETRPHSATLLACIRAI